MTASAVPGPCPVYTGRATNWPMVIISTALVAPLLILGNTGGGPRDLAIPLLVAATGVLLNLLTATSVRTTAGPRGVTVHFGVLGWPRRTYRLDRIRRADVVDLPLRQVAHGFWWTPRRTFCTVRPGPTLRLTLHTGRTVTITTADPGTAVAAIHRAQAG